MDRQRTKENQNYLFQAFRKRIYLLIVDDYPMIRNVLLEIFTSPLFTIFSASSESEARQVLQKVPVWHAWILDIAMENEESGLKLLADNRNFPFAIMLSGIRSMNASSKAMLLGAYKVFDKSPSFLSEIHADICNIAALGYILKGSNTKYLPIFKLLLHGNIYNFEEWATAACLTKRQLERICSTHFNLAPRFIIPLFHTLKHLLMCEENHDTNTSQQCTTNRSAHHHKMDLIDHYHELVIKNLDGIWSL